MDRIAIMGLGLMGGSLGLALSGGSVVRVGYARREEVRQKALDDRVVDEVFADPAEAVEGADLIVLCVPIFTIPDLISACKDRLKAGSIVTDVGSTKTTLMADCTKLLSDTESCFIGSHPVAGSEKQGLEAAIPGLYRNALVAVTPPADLASESLNRVVAFWEGLGSIVRVMSAEEHDRYLARTSHLPHLVASLLALTVSRSPDDETGLFCGTGFQKTSRVADGSPDIWIDIIKSNHAAIATELNSYRDFLDDFLDSLNNADYEKIKDQLTKGRMNRKKLLKASPLKGDKA